MEPVLDHFNRTCTPMNQAEYRVRKREGALDVRRCQHYEAVAARQEEPQIYDPVLNQMERPDRIAL